MTDEEVAAHVATLLPVQQHAIALAQLAGCRFEVRQYRRYLGVSTRDHVVTTTGYDVVLPSGQHLCQAEDIYEGACLALAHLDKPEQVEQQENLTLFRLDPENVSPDEVHGAPRRAAIAPDASGAITGLWFDELKSRN